MLHSRFIWRRVDINFLVTTRRHLIPPISRDWLRDPCSSQWLTMNMPFYNLFCNLFCSIFCFLFSCMSYVLCYQIFYLISVHYPDFDVIQQYRAA